MQKISSSSHFTQSFSLQLILFSILLAPITLAAVNSSSPVVTSDGLSLLAFKSSADPGNKLHFLLKKRFDYCQWQGVKCVQGKVVSLVIEGVGIQGTFADNTLVLDQLRVLSLQNNNLTGPIPNLSKLLNLKTLFLGHNSFTGSFPVSILSLHRIRILDLSNNNLTGEIPTELVNLDRLDYLRLEHNWFNGTVPPLNQSSLRIFNVSRNNLACPVPLTVVLSSFNSSSFFGNSGLCGQIIGRSCSKQNSPFFSFNQPPPQKQEQEQQQQPQQLVADTAKKNTHKRAIPIAGLVFGVSVGVLLLFVSMGFWVMAIRKKSEPNAVSDTDSAAVDEASLSVSEEKLKKMQSFQMGKSGTLIFCAGETQIYSLDELMRASAEMLGRGTIGTTYRAVLENQLIVSVKRLDAHNLSKVSKEMFETQMEMVGSLRHPNLIPLRAYFQAKEERLLIYDYQPNGSLFSLIHGSRSSRAKPLHWTSCLKIAEDVALGLAYIHQASRVFHGNLKSYNVLLGADFEACVADYGLNIFQELDDNSGLGYMSLETRKSNRRLSAKSDVYSFGVLLIELITGKMPLESFVMTVDLHSWVRSVREGEGVEGGAVSNDEKLFMLLDIATVCISSYPDQRPTMRQVVKMIKEIKETETGESTDSTGFPSS